MFSEYDTREEDYTKVKNYINRSILTFVIREIIINGFLINSKIVARISWIVLLKTREFKNKFSITSKIKIYIKSVLNKLKK